MAIRRVLSEMPRETPPGPHSNDLLAALAASMHAPAPVASTGASLSTIAPSLRIPDPPVILKVIGVPEEGCELRVWAREGDAVLGLMRFTWFRLDSGTQAAAEAAAQSASASSGASSQQYKCVFVVVVVASTRCCTVHTQPVEAPEQRSVFASCLAHQPPSPSACLRTPLPAHCTG
jgi:hypothetical protein